MRSGFMQRYLPAAVEFFIHPSLRVDSDQYYRARILVGTLLTFALVPLIAYRIVLSEDFFPNPISATYAAVICLPTSACFIILLVLSRHKGFFSFCGITTVLVIMVSLIAGISVSGGPAESPATQLIVVPPLAAYFFGGRRWGHRVIALSALVLLVLYSLHIQGFAYTQTLGTTQTMQNGHMILNLLNFLIISAMSLTYETSSGILKHERDVEREKYVRLAKVDPLTGLANRRNFDAMLQERMDLLADRVPPPCSALGYLDLDGFKPINDTYGHAVGDEVLRVVSDRLRAALRASDFVGRHGGDEFMLWLDLSEDGEEGCHAAIETMAQRTLNSIALPIKTSAGLVSVGGSLGFAIYPKDSDKIEDLKKHADAAMYEAKQQHGTWRFYRQDMQ